MARPRPEDPSRQTSRQSGRIRAATVAGTAIGLVLLGVLSYVLLTSRHEPEGPQPVAWNREACAHCRMLIGIPSFAAQVHTRAGQVLNFDDPGCAMIYLTETKESPARVYFRHHREEGVWLPRSGVGFVPVEGSPMDYDFGAVRRTDPDAIGYEEARRRVLAEHRRSQHGRGGP